MPTSWITKNKVVSYASNFAFDDLRYKPKKRGPEETCPFKVALCFISFTKSDKTLSNLLVMTFCLS